MAAPAEIRKTASKASESRGKLNQKNSAALNDSNKVNNVWRGEISGAYKDAYKKAQSKTCSSISDLSILKTKLESLASSVNRAALEELKKGMKK